MGRRLRCQDHWRGHWNMRTRAFLFRRPSWKMVEETMFSSAYPVYSYTGLRQFSAWTHSWLSWDLGGYWNNVWNTKLRSIAVLVYLFHICPPCPWVVLELFADQSSNAPRARLHADLDSVVLCQWHWALFHTVSLLFVPGSQFRLSTFDLQNLTDLTAGLSSTRCTSRMQKELNSDRQVEIHNDKYNIYNHIIHIYIIVAKARPDASPSMRINICCEKPIFPTSFSPWSLPIRRLTSRRAAWAPLVCSWTWDQDRPDKWQVNDR